MNCSVVYNKPNVVYSNADLLSVSTSSASSVVGELLYEFINKLSDDHPVYNTSFRGNQATWTYDVDSDITYEANISFDIGGSAVIGLNIYEGYTITDSALFIRLPATSGYVWEEVTI